MAHRSGWNTARSWQAAWRSQEMMASAAMTIGLRTLGMGEAAMGLRPRDHKEESRMVSEKIAAAQDYAFDSLARLPATQVHLTALWMRQWQQWLTTPTAMSVALPMAFWRMGLESYARGLDPYHRRTKANARRLMRRRMTRRPAG